MAFPTCSSFQPSSRGTGSSGCSPVHTVTVAIRDGDQERASPVDGG